MEQVNVHHAKTNLSQLLARVESGEEIVIARAGQPIARLVPFAAPKGKRRPMGGDEGLVVVPDDFDAPLPDDFMKYFE